MLFRSEAGSDPTAVTGQSPLDDNPVAMAAMKEADLVVDLLFLLFTDAQREVMRSGTRILLVYEPPEILARVMPSLDDRRRVLAARETYARGREIRITSKAGTDLRARIEAAFLTLAVLQLGALLWFLRAPASAAAVAAPAPPRVRRSWPRAIGVAGCGLAVATIMGALPRLPAASIARAAR